MKRICLFSVLCWAVMTLVAQNLTVSSMTAASMDISASQYERKDVNGDPCALIKVQLPAIGARFEGNVIGEPEFKTGEYWVYMSSGSQMLRVKHPNVLPLTVTFQDYGIKSVQAKQTYELVLIMPQLIGQEFDDGMRYLVMTVTPAHSIVYIDGQLQQVNNGTVSRRLSMGKHTYRVEAVGFAPQNGTVELGDGKKSLPITLKSVQATLNVTCPTSGSNIYINDQLRGTAPWQGELTAGDYLVEARLNSYRSHRQNITLRESEQRTLAMPALVPITSSLDVNYQPVETEVWIDGKQLGTSPDIFRGVLVGSHQVELRKSGYTPKTVTVNIEEGKTASLIGNLEKIQTKQTTAASSSSSSSGSSSYSASSSGSGSSTYSKFFPYDRVSLGHTTTSQLLNMGFKKSTSSDYYSAPAGFFVYDDNKDGITDRILTSRSDGFPSTWMNLGFDWGLSYNQFQNLLNRYNFSVRVTENPHVEKGNSRSYLMAKLEATSSDGQFKLRFDFENGNANGEGTTVTSRNSLGYIFIYYLGASSGSSSTASSSSYSSSSSSSGQGSPTAPTIEYLFTHPMLFLDGSDISLSRNQMWNKLERLHGSGWRLETNPNDKDIIYLRPNGTAPMVDGRNIEYMFCSYWSSRPHMADFKIDFNDSRFSSLSEAKRWADNLVSKIRAMGFSVNEETRNDNVYYTGSKGNMSYEVRLPMKYYGQLYIDIDYKSANAVTSLGNVASSSSSSSSYSSSSYTASSSSLTMEDLIMHPAGTLSSNNKYQSMNDVIREIQRKQPTWNVKKKNSNSVTVDIDKAYRGLRYFGGTEGCYITFEGSGISFYSYYFDLSDSNIINTVIQDIENLGYRMVSNQNNEITFEGKNNIKRIELDLRERYFFITVWLK